MGADDGEEVVVLQEVAAGGVTVKIGAAPHRIVTEVLGVLLVAELLEGVRPQQVAHGPERGGLFEPVQLHKKTIIKIFLIFFFLFFPLEETINESKLVRAKLL